MWETSGGIKSYFFYEYDTECPKNAKLQTVIQSPYSESKAHAVVQLVEALRYKPGGRGFDSRWFYQDFSLT
jgi:hypothetical protein